MVRVDTATSDRTRTRARSVGHPRVLAGPRRRTRRRPWSAPGTVGGGVAGPIRSTIDRYGAGDWEPSRSQRESLIRADRCPSSSRGLEYATAYDDDGVAQAALLPDVATSPDQDGPCPVSVTSTQLPSHRSSGRCVKCSPRAGPELVDQRRATSSAIPGARAARHRRSAPRDGGRGDWTTPLTTGAVVAGLALARMSDPLTVVRSWCPSGSCGGRNGAEERRRPLTLLVKGLSWVVGDTRIELVTSSVSRKRSPTELIARGGDGNRTRVQGFAGPCLSHSATPPLEAQQ